MDSGRRSWPMGRWKIQGREDYFRGVLIDAIKHCRYDMRAVAAMLKVSESTINNRCSKLEVRAWPKGQYHSDEEIQELGKLNDWNKSQVCKMLGMRQPTFAVLLKKRGISWEGYSKRKLRLADTEVIQSLYESGMSIKEVAQRFSVAESTMKREMRMRGIKIRSGQVPPPGGGPFQRRPRTEPRLTDSGAECAPMVKP